MYRYTLFVFLTANNVVLPTNIKSILTPDRNTFDPEIFYDTKQILQKYNYTSESHAVYTEDGYLLTLFRIPGNGPPVLLAHGIGDSSDEWLVLGPKSSLGFLLADSGYDVWLFNSRGNRYSKRHRKKLTKKDYWNFSYEEIGTRDLPACIDYILSVTNKPKINFVGFSQGCTAFLVLCSVKTVYNNKIDHAIMLAPVAWLNNTKHPFLGILTGSLNELEIYSKYKKIYEFPSADERNILYHASVCNVTSTLNILCGLETYVLFGLQKITNLSPERLPVVVSHTSTGFSFKTVLHYLQSSVSKRFSRYDYGKSENKLLYCTPVPPDYDISLISVPMTMFASEVDWFASPDDVEILKRRMTSEVKLNVIKKSIQFTHLEFVYGARVNTHVNIPILELLNKL